MKTTQLK